MKKLICIIVCILLVLFIDSKVHAALTSKNTEIECIYANGVVVGMNYDAATGNRSAYVREYPLSKTTIIEGDPITNISLFNIEHAKERLNGLTCPSEIRYWIAWSLASSDSDNNGKKSLRGVYSFDWCTNKASECSGTDPAITGSLRANTTVGGWWIFPGKDVQTNGTIPVTGTNLLNEEWQTGDDYPEAIIPLVGERLYIVDDITSGTYSHTFKLMGSGAEQAVGEVRYAQMYKGQKNQYYLQLGKTITKLELGDNIATKLNNASKEEELYVCIKESTTTQDADRGDSLYKFSSVRHEITAVVGKKKPCPTGSEKYMRTTENCKIEVSTPKDSFCDKYSNTSKVLIDIIKIMQILVPAVVIVFTGIEIGRIVLAGNVEEELPKRKKSILIRLIVMIAFFLLPFITQLIVSLAEGVSILDVSCLFNDGIQIKNEEITEANCADAIDVCSECHTQKTSCEDTCSTQYSPDTDGENYQECVYNCGTAYENCCEAANK